MRPKASHLLTGLLTLLLAISLLGCAAKVPQVEAEVTPSIETTDTALSLDAESVQSSDTEADADSPSPDQESGDGPSGEQSGQSSSAPAAAGSQTPSGSGGSGAASGSGGSGGSGSAVMGGGSAATSSSGQSSSAPQNTTPKTITVSIEIEARTAYASDPAAMAGIASGGVILSRRNITLPEGATVRQALDATGVRVNARGAYIVGIGGLAEGDFGARSGWMFSVNGAFASASASTLRLNAGDRVAWRYTLNHGADIGGRW
ncbi:MAG: DUF4430 domain-containing protein [Coriobacteriia bacterium]|nr:DUF4430 domain-containing protein [Coriobacteriia bacterium]